MIWHSTARSRSGWVAASIVVVVLALIASACGGSGSSDADDSGSTSTSAAQGTVDESSATTVTTADDSQRSAEPTTSTTAAVPEFYPLTGLPVDDPATLNRLAIGAKIDNVAAARPQAGLNAADIVYEERVEGGLTRLLAVFHSTDAVDLGPIRSARSTDVPLLTPLSQPLFAWSGANAAFAALIRSVAIIDMGFEAQPHLYERRAGRSAPSNLFTSTVDLYNVASSDDQDRDDLPTDPPQPAFVFRTPGSNPDGADVAGVEVGVEVGGVEVSYRGTTVSHVWSEDHAGWLREQNGTPHVDTDGQQVAPTNVVVQFVEYVASGQVDSAGSVVPEAVLEGSGEVWVLMDGRVVTGTWSKPNVTAPATYLDDNGDTLALQPGTTWVLLAEPGFATLS